MSEPHPTPWSKEPAVPVHLMLAGLKQVSITTASETAFTDCIPILWFLFSGDEGLPDTTQAIIWWPVF